MQKKWSIALIVLTALLATLFVVIQQNQREPARREIPSSTACIKKFEVNGAKSWRKDLPTEETPTVIRAEEITEGHTPVPHLASYTAEGKPILWYSPDKTRVVVDRTLFTDLTVVDGTTMGPGASQRLGRYLKPLAFPNTRDFLVPFLIESEIIETSIHVGAELCLRGEIFKDNPYVALFDATYTYCTNECRTVPYSFKIIFDGETGDIEIE